MTAAIYTRVSLDEQVKHGVSLAAQEAACLAYCARAGLLSYEALAAVNQPLMAEREQLQAKLDAQAEDATDAVAELARALGKRGVLRALRRADGDTQLAALGALIERVELHQGRRVVFVCRGLPDVERVLPRYYSAKRGVTDVGF